MFPDVYLNEPLKIGHPVTVKWAEQIGTVRSIQIDQDGVPLIYVDILEKYSDQPYELRTVVCRFGEIQRHSVTMGVIGS